ncbi:c-type cytochrome [Methylotetracoccus oryzae]|uniref:c-type cytochrome n=1 Tax=Methylotetracoccus oryzae TaxID=1919059 RepID=UPI002E26A87F
MVKELAWGLLLAPMVVHAETLKAERQQQLLNLLKQDCGSCHGLQFKGGLGPPLLPEALSGKPDSTLIDTIVNGRPGTAMPPWRGFLTADEAAWLVNQLRNPQ